MKPDRLEFPFGAPPLTGEVTRIAPGIYWACLPLPFRLDHVNVWLLEENDGWTVIDTGCAAPAVIDAWETILAGPMGGRAIRNVVTTHGHVDHMGLAGWLVERFDAELIGTFAEWIWARISHAYDLPGSDVAHHRYFKRHGFEESESVRMLESRRQFIDLSTTIPGAITEIRDGEIVHMGGRDWTVIVTGGHAIEHASFYNASDNILIAGDHLLPKISPVIAVYEMAPKANPLGDYLESFSQFAKISKDTLVLPSHGMPYRGIQERVDELRQHHSHRLDSVISLLGDPQNGRDLSKALFPHIDGVVDIGFALGETLAHVNYLVDKGSVTDERNKLGHDIYALR